MVRENQLVFFKAMAGEVFHLDKRVGAYQHHGMGTAPPPDQPPSFLVRFGMRLALLWEAVGPLLRYLVLIRVAMLGAIVALLLPLLANGPLRTLVLGAYDVNGFKDGMLAAFIAYTLAGCLTHQRKVVDMNGKARFNQDLTRPAAASAAFWRWLMWAMVFSNVVMVVRASPREHAVENALGIVAGLGVASGIGLLLLKRELKPGSATWSGWPVTWLARVSMGPVPGVLVARDESKVYSSANVCLAPGHLPAVLQAIALVVLIVLAPRALPPIASVLGLIALITTVLSGIAFFADRQRIPTLLCLIVWCSLMTLWQESDHFYRIWPRQEPSLLPSPAQVIGRAAAKKEPIVIVTAAGGGIQSAAWTVAALDEFAKQKGLGDKFHQSVRLISGVSGGSVGALHYVHAFDSKQPDRFALAAKAASASSLREATAGMVRWDFPRVIAPMFFAIGNGLTLDRGSMIQEAWAENNAREFGGESDFPALANATLTHWAQDAAMLKRPAVLFNSTLVETGERFALCTAPCRRAGTGSIEFTRRYLADISMVTAARLSATFPVISPSARPAVGESEKASPWVLPGQKLWDVFPDGGSLLHAVDGGYFENSGIIGAIEWLDEALSDLADPSKRASDEALPAQILILELEAFLPEKAPTRGVDYDDRPGGVVADLISPLVTIANVRNSGQASFAHLALEQFQRNWEKRGVDICHVRVQPDRAFAESQKKVKEDREGGFFIQGDWEYAPLSWHLRAPEIEAINEMARRIVPVTMKRLAATFQPKANQASVATIELDPIGEGPRTAPLLQAPPPPQRDGVLKPARQPAVSAPKDDLLLSQKPSAPPVALDKDSPRLIASQAQVRVLPQVTLAKKQEVRVVETNQHVLQRFFGVDDTPKPAAQPEAGSPKP